MHRVEDAAHVVLGEIHERARRERMYEGALKDERKIETDDVVADELVTVRIEVFHEVQKRLKRLFLVLLVAVLIDSEDVFARLRSEIRKLETRNRADVQRSGEYAAGSGTESAECVATFFFGGDVFEISLLLFD